MRNYEELERGRERGKEVGRVRERERGRDSERWKEVERVREGEREVGKEGTSPSPLLRVRARLLCMPLSQ